MAARYRVEARWDPEARVWTSVSDLPGLVIETATLGKFEGLVLELAPDLLADSGLSRQSVTIEWSAHGAIDLVAA